MAMTQWEVSERDIQYSDNVALELVQNPGILYGLAGKGGNHAGAVEARIETRFDKMSLQKKTARNGDTNYVNVDSKNRFIKKPGSSNVATLIDRDAVNSTSVDPKSPLVMQTARAVRKYRDDQFLSGWWGNAYEGAESSSSTVAFPSAQKIARNFGGSDVGLTLGKLIELKRQLKKANVDFTSEQPIILLDADAESDLMNIDKYQNIQYNGTKPLTTGELVPWMGFRFIQANLGDSAAYPTAYSFFKPGSYNQLPVIIPSGIYRGTWVEFFGKAGTPMPDKQWSEQIYAEAEEAFVRTDEAKAWFIETVPLP
jgi:hypothetical protein